MATERARNNKDDERKFMLEVIEVYQTLPSLWKIKSNDYFNKENKIEAYKKLHQKYKERFPESTVDELKKKLNTLRTNFRGELRKVERSAKSGAGVEDLYHPTSWYYDALKFLTDQETPSNSLSTLSLVRVDQASQDTEYDNLSQSSGNDIGQDEDERAENPEASTVNQETVTSNEGTRTPPLLTVRRAPCPKINARTAKTTTKKRKVSESQKSKDELISLATARLKEPVPDEDQYLAQAKVWANELRSMNPTQQMYVKKAVNDILFEGQCGTLNRNSVQINSGGQFTTLSSRCSTPFSAGSDQQAQTSVYTLNASTVENHGQSLANYFSRFDPSN